MVDELLQQLVVVPEDFALVVAAVVAVALAGVAVVLVSVASVVQSQWQSRSQLQCAVADLVPDPHYLPQLVPDYLERLGCSLVVALHLALDSCQLGQFYFLQFRLLLHEIEQFCWHLVLRFLLLLRVDVVVVLSLFFLTVALTLLPAFRILCFSGCKTQRKRVKI